MGILYLAQANIVAYKMLKYTTSINITYGSIDCFFNSINPLIKKIKIGNAKIIKATDFLVVSPRIQNAGICFTIFSKNCKGLSTI